MNMRNILRRALLPAVLGLTALATGCSDGENQNSAGTGGAGGSGGMGGAGGSGGSGGSAAIEWGSCPSDFISECATVALPLDPAKPEGKTLPVFISRHLAKGGAAKAQVWLLQGGPGGSGNVYKGAIEQLWQNVMPDVDWYVLEHRGVGPSSRLGCATEEDASSEGGAEITAKEWPACMQALKAKWGEDLAHFTITADTEDLARLIALTREPGKKVVVYGASYGTTRAMRFLQAHPDGADAVILDSVVSPGEQYLSQFDTQYDPVAQDLAAICAADPVCGAKLGPEPWAKVDALFDKLAMGHCADLGMNVELLRALAPLFVQTSTLRTHIFPLVYRLDRCEPGDVQVVGHYLQTLLKLLGQGGGGELRGSSALQNHIALSELWEQPAPTVAELQARCDAQRFCPGLGPSIGGLYDTWPRYTPDKYWNGWPTSTVPILAMNGLLDPQTPIGPAKIAANKLTAPHQTFVAVPWSPHGVAFESPVKTANAAPCGTQMMAKFIADPEAPIDTTCLDDLQPVTWNEDPMIVNMLFGTDDMWENKAPLAPEQKKPVAVDWTALLRLARQKTGPIAR